MNRMMSLVSAIGLVWLMLPGSGDAKGKPGLNTPGTAVFRCNPTCPLGFFDRILGDGTNYAGNDATEPAHGALLRGTTNGYYYMWIGARGGHSLTVDFGDPDGPAPCLATSSCRWPAGSFLTTEASIETKVIASPEPADPANEVEAPNGLIDVPVGATWRSRLNITLPDPGGRDLLWRLNFRRTDYTGGTNVDVTRTNSCTWEFEADTNDRAGLSAWGNVTNKGKSTRTDEGLFRMPVKITFSTCTT